MERLRAEGEKWASEDEMAEQHHQCNEHELGQTLGDGEGQVGLVCCSPWGSQRVKHNWVTEQQHLCIIYMQDSIFFECLGNKRLHVLEPVFNWDQNMNVSLFY